MSAARTCRIVEPGFFTTVQDLGRTGFQRYGVPVSGAMDVFALRAANALVGNEDGAACLEMTLAGPELIFDVPARMAITGGDLGPTLDGRPLRMWQAVDVPAGASLAFSGRRDGFRAYLACAGGIDVAPVLGSRSTFTRSALGGLSGRALRAEDAVPLRVPGPEVPLRRLGRREIPAFGTEHLVRVVWGPQDDAFTDAGRETFLASTFVVSPQSDRIGCRLQGPTIGHRAGADIVSDGTAFGAIQVSGDGQPIVLMADRGTTGGYTKIATVISADLMRLAQAAPGDRVRFRAVTRHEAVGLLREQEAVLASIGEDRGEVFDKPDGPVFDEDAADAYLAEASEDLSDAIDRTRRR